MQKGYLKVASETETWNVSTRTALRHIETQSKKKAKGRFMTEQNADLQNLTVAVVATNGFEDSELTSPLEAAQSAGATVHVVSTEAGVLKGKNGTEVNVDKLTKDVSADDYGALILPGGTGNADTIRTDEAAVSLVKKLVEKGAPTAVICHGGWILTDADVVKGRTLTSYRSIKTDLINAGANWVDEEVHTDKGLVSSRTPDDLPAFNAKMLEEFAEGNHANRK